MELNVEMATADISSKKFGEYVKQFPDLIGYFTSLKSKPNCDGCAQKVLIELSKKDDLEKKLKNIYGNDVEVGKDILLYKNRVTPTITSSITEVFFVLKDDYKAFIEEFTRDKIVRVIDATYISETSEMCVTIVYNLILKQ